MKRRTDAEQRKVDQGAAENGEWRPPPRRRARAPEIDMTDLTLREQVPVARLHAVQCFQRQDAPTERRANIQNVGTDVKFSMGRTFSAKLEMRQ